MKSTSWLSKYQHRKFGNMTLVSLALADIAKIQNDAEARMAITGDTLVASAFVKNAGDTSFVVIVLDQPLQPGEKIPTINLDEMGTDVIPLASFFGTGDGVQYLNVGSNPSALDPRYVQGVCDFLASRDGTFMKPGDKIADLRFVGDTFTTLQRRGTEITEFAQIVVLGFSPAAGKLVAVSDDGTLLMQDVRELADPDTDADDTDAWRTIANVDNGIYRMGRLELHDEEIVAPISMKQGGVSKNGEIVINIATDVGEVTLNDNRAFVMTTTRVVSDAKPVVSDKRDPLQLITYDETDGLGMSMIGDDAQGQKGKPYTRYRSAAAQQLQI
jgi:hypothetical protein